MVLARTTRRRVLAAGAATGIGSLLARPLAACAWSGAPGGTTARSFGLDVLEEAFAGGRVSAVLRAPQRFDLLGLSGGAPAGAEVRARRRDGTWSRWTAFGGGHTHAPDRPGGVQAPATDPVWTGATRFFQLRLPAAPRRPLRAHFVAVPPAVRRRGAVASRATPRAAAAAAQAAPGSPPPIITRAQWGGDKVTPRAAPEHGEVRMAFVHHTVTANEYGPEDSAGIVLSIAKYHRDSNGWNDIGYNFLVDKYGQIFEGRAGGIDQAIIGAQAQGYNRLSTGVANLGTFSAAGQSEPALEALARLIGWKLSLHGAPVEGQLTVESAGGSTNRYPSGRQVTFERISGHRDGDQTECPGTALYAQLPELRRRAAKYATATAVAERLTLAATASAVRYGEGLAVRGAFTGSDGAAVRGAHVSLQKRSASGAWVTLASARTGDDGGFTASVPWRRDGTLRARAQAPGASRPTLSAPVGATVIPVLTARPVQRRARAGTTVVVAGTIRPAGRVQVLVERQDRLGRWRRVAVVPVRVAGGAFRAPVALTQPALYRLTPSAGAGVAKAAGPAAYVRATRAPKRAARRKGGNSRGGAEAPGGPRAPSTGGIGG
jgi:hypothetical protein